MTTQEQVNNSYAVGYVGKHGYGVELTVIKSVPHTELTQINITWPEFLDLYQAMTQLLEGHDHGGESCATASCDRAWAR